ncbi:MAG: hypothetical protein U0992_03780 [Planctomycetaceae bacterium]
MQELAAGRILEQPVTGEWTPAISILLEDGPLLAINKPPGIITQGAPARVEGLVELARRYLKEVPQTG